MSKLPEQISEADAGLVYSTLEPDQLAEAKKAAVPRRTLGGRELVVLWTLRVYLLFMVAVVCWQVWTAAR
jgi:hypothetical protein